MASSSGCHVEKATKAVENKIFKDTELHSNAKIIQINSGHFYHGLANILKTDLLPILAILSAQIQSYSRENEKKWKTELF